MDKQSRLQSNLHLGIQMMRKMMRCQGCRIEMNMVGKVVKDGPAKLKRKKERERGECRMTLTLRLEDQVRRERKAKRMGYKAKVRSQAKRLGERG